MKRSEFLKGAAVLLAAPTALAKMTAATGATATLGPAATTLTTNGAYFRAGDIIRIVSTGEAIQVRSVCARSIEVVRGIGSMPPQPFKTAEAVLVGSAAFEGAKLPPPRKPRVVRLAA